MNYCTNKKKIIARSLAFALIMLFNVNGFSQEAYSSSDSIKFEVTVTPGNFIYVDDDNTSGPWTGSETFPFENIPEAITASSPGVTVVVLPGNYPINLNLTVPADVKLFLSQGDTLVFGSNNSLQINGRLQAFGTSNDTIFFTASGSNWDGIRFVNSQSQSELRYCNLTNSIGTTGNLGGGIYTSNSNVMLFGCLIENCSANLGAGIYSENNSLLFLEETTLKNNKANISGGGFYGTAMDSLVIVNTVFESNTATSSNGGGMFLQNSPLVLNENNFIGNDAANGGGIYLSNVSVDSSHFVWNTFKSNTASSNGGGLFVNNSNTLDLSRNLFRNNSATDGGAIFLNNSQALVYNNTLFANNATGPGGGLASSGGTNEIFNNVCWENTSSNGSQISGTGVNVTYNNVDGGFAGTGNISSYPLFVDTASNNFNLQIKSPCINAGDPGVSPDPDSTIADMGINYFHHQLAVITSQPDDATVSDGQSTSFSIQADWALNYQWQVSTDGGSIWADVTDPLIYNDFTSTTLLLNNIPLTMNGYAYRCQVFGAGTIPMISDTVSLTVHPVITAYAASVNSCEGDIYFPISASQCNDVGAISLILDYDESFLTYTSYQNQHPELSGGSLIVNAFNGKIYISWASLTPANIGDGLVLELLFTALQGSGNMIWDTVTSGNCEFSDSNGNVILSNYANGSVISSNCVTQLDIKVFLQGPFNGSDMDVNVNHLIPYSQPYGGPPWNYSGTENVSYLSNGNIVDWGLLELRETTGDASSAPASTMVAQQAVFILNDGKIKSLDGSNLPKFTQAITDNLFVVFRHRNHIPIISANAVTISGSAYTYDFTTGSGQVYGGTSGHTEIGTGIWGMMAGDGDADGLVDINDKNNVWATEAGTKGYLMGDFNLNEQVNNADKNDGWAPNNGSSSQVPN